MDWIGAVSGLREETLALLIPIVAIVSAFLVGGILGLTRLIFRHRERMAMIERGMLHPDLLERGEEAEGPTR